jgi:hypothetical protein
MAEKLDPKTQAVMDAVVAAQGMALSTQYIIRELLIDVARLHSSPDRYLTDLYDRVSRISDPSDGDLNKPERKVYGATRDWLSDIFAGALKRIRNTRDQGEI